MGKGSSIEHASFVVRAEAAPCARWHPRLLAAKSLTNSVTMRVGATRWLADFHAGDRAVLEKCYRDHHATVVRTIGRMLAGADAETVTHEVFYRLLSNAKLRENFQGGRFDAWLTQVATNAARDFLRRYRREQAEIPETSPAREGSHAAAEEMDAKVMVERFRRDCLPPDLAGVFDARFLRQLPQRQAASELGMPRTTLVYQEQRIRSLLREFVLGGAP
jgi:RNA polymerase sigma-70 factor (ECF subfamily)